MTGVSLRRAAVDDATAIARIWREGWADGHEGHVPDALAAARTPASFDVRAMERIDHTWVAESAGAVAGFVVVVDAEVEQLYVDRSWRGGGVAERLLRHAEAMIGREGRRTAWLAVVAGNTRARRFYARLGWRDRGAFTYQAQTATARSRFPPIDTSARWATDEIPAATARAAPTRPATDWGCSRRRCSASAPQPEPR